ncbi:MAG: diacylglycerol kinase family protein [Provencibacterium sp.]|jgi:diacylglycerol kinase (ATP)|nr:diacylglycerol kinase family protein [Provencibacterium sp.]
MNRQLGGLAHSFRCAVKGIACCVRSERNLRIHLSIAAGVLLLSVFYDFSAVQWALLILLFALVLSAEMMNTAIERAVDLFSPGYHELAGRAKDTAAGAVLVTAAAAVIVGLLFFLNREGLTNILLFLRARPLIFCLGIAAYTILAAGFIFRPWGGAPEREGLWKK